MAGISSKAAGGLQNRKKFNDGTELENGEFSDGSGLELYSTEFRSYDAQIGRFHQIDDLANEFECISPYSFANNNPILFNDPFGLSVDSTGNSLPVQPETSTSQNPKQLQEVVIYCPPRDGLKIPTQSSTPQPIILPPPVKGNRSQNSVNGSLITAGGVLVVSNPETYPVVTIIGAGVIAGYSTYLIFTQQHSIATNPAIPNYGASVRDNTNHVYQPIVLQANDKTDYMGKARGNTPGNNQAQNKQVESLAKKYNLSDKEKRQLHDYISKEGYGYKEIENIIKNNEYK